MGDDQTTGLEALDALEAQAQMRLANLLGQRERLMQTYIQPLDREIRRHEEQLKLLTELKATFEPSLDRHATDSPIYDLGMAVSPPADLDLVGPKSPAMAIGLRSSSQFSVRERMRTRVREVLRERGEPMHINEIHAEFEKRGWPVPGLGKPVNITTHLTNAEGIYSPRRGFYALGHAPATSSSKAARRRTTARRTLQKGKQ